MHCWLKKRYPKSCLKDTTLQSLFDVRLRQKKKNPSFVVQSHIHLLQRTLHQAATYTCYLKQPQPLHPTSSSSSSVTVSLCRCQQPHCSVMISISEAPKESFSCGLGSKRRIREMSSLILNIPDYCTSGLTCG